MIIGKFALRAQVAGNYLVAHNEAHTALVREALQELALQGYTAWATNTGAYKTESGGFIKYGKIGGGDITGILGPHGRYFEAEAKTGTGRQSKNQKLHQEFVVERNGGIYILFRSVPELLETIKRAEQIRRTETPRTQPQ